MQIKWSNRDIMQSETEWCYSQIVGIQEFIDIQNKIYNSDYNSLCLGDYQIDYIDYSRN